MADDGVTVRPIRAIVQGIWTLILDSRAVGRDKLSSAAVGIVDPPTLGAPVGSGWKCR